MIKDNLNKITIAICTHNRGKILCESVQKIIDTCCIKDFVEILIVDNASTDDTARAIQQIINYGLGKNVTISTCHEEKLGLSNARNRAIAECKTSIIAFIDDDAYIDSTWCDAIYQEFSENNDAVGCGGPVIAVYEVPRPEWLSNRLMWAYSVGDHGNKDRDYKYPEHPLGVNMAFNLSNLNGLRFNESLGRKGESLVSWEESDFFKNLNNKRAKVKYSCKAIVYHIIPANRLTRDWLCRRHIAEGISIARAHLESCGNFKQNIILILASLMATSLILAYLIKGGGKVGFLFKMKAVFYLSLAKELILGRKYY